MVISVHNNFMSFGIQRNLANSTGNLRTITQRLSTGVRINSAADDAANLDLSTKLDSKTSGLSVANRNINTAMGKLQTFDGHLDSIGHSLQKVRTLAVQAANGVYSQSERAALSSNAKELMKDVDNAAKSANTEIGVKTFNTAGFIQEVDQLSEAEAIAAGYDQDHIIQNAQEFIDKITGNEGEDFILAGDIDFSDLGTLTDSPISAEFTGNFDGNGYVIQNLTISTSATLDQAGLFAMTNSGAEIKNVGVENVNITAAASDDIGALVGILNGGSKITNSYSTGNIASTIRIGGLVSKSDNASEISYSYSSVNIQGTEQVGGLIGHNANSKISHSYATGKISGTNYSGGLVGVNSGGTIENSYATGDINGAPRSGGLAGWASGTIKNSFATGDINGGSWVGGFVGVPSGLTITDSYSTGNVTSSGTSSGGFIGDGDNSTISGSYSSGNVTTAGAYAGGFIGVNRSGMTIKDSYSTGTVSATDNAGGFTGWSAGSITNSYTTGDINSSGSNTGGFVGNFGGGTIDGTNFYKNNMTTDNASATTDIKAATESWDKNIWGTSGEKPQLLWDQKDNETSIQTGSETYAESSYNIKYLGVNFNEEGGTYFNLSTAQGAREAIEAIDNAINYLSEKRSEVGSGINSLEMITKNNNERHDNLLSSNSTIKDTDMAIEAANMTKNQILQQSSTSLLQQAQQINSSLILNLL